MNGFYDELIAATKRHGVPCIVIGGGAGYVEDDDGFDSTAPEFAEADDGPEGDEEELVKLRSQVQSLTAQLQEAQVPVSEGAQAVIPAGDYGSQDHQSIDALGLGDEKLVKKLMRLGNETIGKLRAALSEGKLHEAKIKKDWLIEIGMKLAGASPSGGSVPHINGNGTGAGATADEGDAPTGHADQPWMERLSVARGKQHELDELGETHTIKSAEADKYTKKGKEVPEDLDEEVLKLEDDIAILKAQLVAMRWCMGLDPNEEITLDDSLQRANLGPWMENAQPRLAPQG